METKRFDVQGVKFLLHLFFFLLLRRLFLLSDTEKWELAFCKRLGINHEDFREGGFKLRIRNWDRPLDNGSHGAVNIDAIQVPSNLKIGNHLYQLSNALTVAQYLQVREVLIPENSLLKPFFKIDGIKFRQGGAHGKNTVNGHWFSSRPFQSLVTIDPVANLHKFHEALVPLSGKIGFSKLNLSNLRLIMLRGSNWVTRDLTVHIRSGDIFETSSPNPKYAQPPLSFYLRAIDKFSPRRVTLVFENESNPVIQKLIAEIRAQGISCRIIDGALSEAIRHLSAARNIVVGTGTFAVPFIAFRPGPINVFSFGRGSKALERIGNRSFSAYLCVDEVYERVMTPCTNSQIQRENMISHKISANAFEDVD